MLDIHYIKIIARNKNINPMKDDTCQRNNTGFPSGTGAPTFMEVPTFGALFKNIEKKSKV